MGNQCRSFCLRTIPSDSHHGPGSQLRRHCNCQHGARGESQRVSKTILFEPCDARQQRKRKPRLASFTEGITGGRVLPASSAGYWFPSLSCVLEDLQAPPRRSFPSGAIFCPSFQSAETSRHIQRRCFITLADMLYAWARRLGFGIRFFVPDDSKFIASKPVFDAETRFCIKANTVGFRRQARDEVGQVPNAFQFSGFLWLIGRPQCLQPPRGPGAGNPARINFKSNVKHLSASYAYNPPPEAGSVFVCCHGRHDPPGLISPGLA
jgi:hypothetical protein